MAELDQKVLNCEVTLSPQPLGLRGAFARRIAGNRATSADNTPRRTTFTTTKELHTVATSVSADHVAVSMRFKEKK